MFAWFPAPGENATKGQDKHRDTGEGNGYKEDDDAEILAKLLTRNPSGIGTLSRIARLRTGDPANDHSTDHRDPEKENDNRRNETADGSENTLGKQHGFEW